MKVDFSAWPVVKVELTRRNLTTLLAKLDDPLSAGTLGKDGDGGYLLVAAVEDEAHYSDREPGVVYMPSEGVYL